MTTFQVTVQRSISTTVEVEAEDADAAIDIVEKASFELPPRDQWDGHKDWIFTVTDDDGELLAERES